MDLTHVNPKMTAEVLGTNQFNEIDRHSPATNLGIDRNIRQSYVNQFIVGLERELIPNFSATVQYMTRKFKDTMGFIDTGSIYAPVQRQDPGPDGRLGTGDDGALLTVYNKTNPGHEFLLFTNPANAARDYKAFQLIGHKRFSSNWQASLSYTWSDTHGTWNNIGGADSRRGGGGPGLRPAGGVARPHH